MELLKHRSVRNGAAVAAKMVLCASVGFGVGSMIASKTESLVYGEKTLQMTTHDVVVAGDQCYAQLETSNAGNALPEACDDLRPLFQATPGSGIFVYDAPTFASNLQDELQRRGKNEEETQMVCATGAAVIALALSVGGILDRRRPEGE